MQKLIKIIIVGDQNVGKSCLLSQFLDGKFNQYYEPTIGLEFGKKELNQKEIKLHLWDMSGQKENKFMARSYYKEADQAILVYDITQRASFHNLNYWMEEANHYTQNEKKEKRFVLVANKIDEFESRVISSQEGQDFAKINNLIYIEASAKTGQHVEEIFTKYTKQHEQKISDTTQYFLK